MNRVIIGIVFLALSACLCAQEKLSAVKPRVFLLSQSHVSGWHVSRNQSMEMSNDFQEVCPDVQISLDRGMVDYTVELNHIEHGVLRDNQMQVANKAGDLVSKVKEAGSIKGGVKKACAVIIADWAKRQD